MSAWCTAVCTCGICTFIFDQSAAGREVPVLGGPTEGGQGGVVPIWALWRTRPDEPGPVL